MHMVDKFVNVGGTDPKKEVSKVHLILYKSSASSCTI